MANAQGKLNALRKSNQDRAEALAAQDGHLHPMTLMDAKLDAIIEHLGCHVKLEEQIATRLDIAEEQLKDIKLRQALTIP